MVNLQSLIAEFRRLFPGSAPAVVARAPGRVNLIGEHVDYNGGIVMPMAIDLATWVSAGRRDDSRVVARSLQSAEAVDFDTEHIGEPIKGWGAYVQGVVHELQARGMARCGMSLLIDSDVPVGAGLSSSAALEAATALAALGLSGHTLTQAEIVQACRTAEHDFARVPCGVMDQMASLCSRADEVMLLDCRSGLAEFVRWPWEDVIVVAVDSCSPHRLSAGTYAQRVRECEAARPHLRDEGGRPSDFRDASLSRLEADASAMQPTILRRARHVVSEIARVQAAAASLRRGDFRSLGRLLDAAHQSLAEDYDVSTPQLDDLARLLRGVQGVHGARLTGAGFGGCVIALADRAAYSGIVESVRRDYDPRYNITARTWICRPAAGASVQQIGG